MKFRSIFILLLIFVLFAGVACAGELQAADRAGLPRLDRQSGRKIEDGVLIDLPLTRQDLAEMTGTTLYTVSRVLTEWDNQGLVQSQRQRVVIRAPHRLVKIGEDLPDPAEEKPKLLGKELCDL